MPEQDQSPSHFIHVRLVFARLKYNLANHHPSAFLLVAQLALLILYALFSDLQSQPALLSAISALILVLVLWVISRSTTSVQWIAWGLALPAFVLSILAALLGTPGFFAWSSLLEGFLYFYTAGSLIHYMMSDENVTSDELFAAGATFTLLAWGFAHWYSVCLHWVPGSFINGAAPGESLTFIEMLFLSFTNLSATGLGDILPISAPARVIAMLEQFSGIGYVTVVVSRLIGLTINKKARRKSSSHDSDS